MNKVEIDWIREWVESNESLIRLGWNYKIA